MTPQELHIWISSKNNSWEKITTSSSPPPPPLFLMQAKIEKIVCSKVLSQLRGLNHPNFMATFWIYLIYQTTIYFFKNLNLLKFSRQPASNNFKLSKYFRIWGTPPEALIKLLNISQSTHFLKREFIVCLNRYFWWFLMGHRDKFGVHAKKSHYTKT